MAAVMPVGKAQQVILDILGQRAGSFGHAERIFADHGIVVSSKRVGRGSVPVVRVVRAGGYGQSEDGDYGDPTTRAILTTEQRAALAPFMA